MARITLVQTTSKDDLDANLNIARQRIVEALDHGPDLLAFPEVFLYLGGRSKKLELAEQLDGPLVSEFRELAAKHGMMILLGSLHERIPDNADRVYNTSVLVGADGEIKGVYRKRKLFDVELPHLRLKESDTIVAGTEDPPVVDTPIGRIGLTICFDLRFSPLYLGLRERGAEIICIPSNFTAPTGQAHWETLLRARAIEHQVFVVAPAQVGQHNPMYTSHGHSMIIDPWGRILASMPDQVGLCTAEIDLEMLRKVRSELPMHVNESVPEAATPAATVAAALDM